MKTLDYIDMHMKWMDEETGKWHGYAIKRDIRTVPIGLSVIKRPEEITGHIDYHAFVGMYFGLRIRRIRWVRRWSVVLKKLVVVI